MFDRLEKIKMLIMSSRFLNRTTFGNEKNKGRLVSVEEANALLQDWVPNERLRLHMRQVAANMKAWAIEKEGADEHTALKWELAGLLHDADWEKYPDDHCRIIIEELERRNIDPDVIRCIASHGPKVFGVEPLSRMDKMIYAIDELSGFIHAYSLMRSENYNGMEVKGVKKRLKDKSFAAGVNREDIQEAALLAEINVDDLIRFIIDHQKDVL